VGKQNRPYRDKIYGKFNNAFLSIAILTNWIFPCA